MNKPLVSVCLLTYMQQNYIEDCLKGIISQTYPDMELLILDDASTDRTFEIIKSYEKALRDKFHYLLMVQHEQNCGNICANMNWFLDKIRGEYIMFCAGDDIMYRDCITALTAQLEKHREKILCYSNICFVDENFKFGDLPGQGEIYRPYVLPQKKDIFNTLMKGNYIPAISVMIRKQAYEKYGGYDENIGYEDYDYWLKLSRKEDFLYLPRCLVYYRRAGGSLYNFKTADGKRKLIFMMKEEKKVLQKYLKWLSKRLWKECKGNYFNRYLKLAIEAGLWDIVIQIMVFMRRHKYEVINVNLSEHFKSERKG